MRTVRLTLIEHIAGSSMFNLQPKDFSQMERKQIIKQIIDGETAAYTRNLRLRDLYTRNVVMEPNPDSKDNRIRRVVLLDFGHVTLSRDWDEDFEKEKKKDLPGTYITPLLRWHEVWSSKRGLSDWIDWDYQPWFRAEYAHTESSVTPYMKSRWLPDLVFEARKMKPDDEDLLLGRLSQHSSAGTAVKGSSFLRDAYVKLLRWR
ncbi:hypothetical protein AJ79_00042 [Helicocarpus griseus UAMH5409]|uniref:Protein kinase domain-containing protein n=1 Tax=Helicocarpus griseus UAMH5409 TaxID=1447875 RepID=A0A2B7YDN3_9EURO|nr:hypothetical protein AJ79_00042 [Helicocarpus griseus UAMH5409]